ncbi:MAG: hypothetical protein KAG66_15105, partial [Methylococcales bacterium]|nr:hypothetical protein [Methylococcales bacterium]
PDFAGLKKKISLWMSSGFRIRIDMNESVPGSDFLDFWKSLTEEQVAAIELIEDPCEWDDPSWAQIRSEGVRIAVDRDAPNRLRAGDVEVYKPASQKSRNPIAQKFFVTSYMDHAIGQMWATFIAAKSLKEFGSDRLLTCGLMTHRCFEPDVFFGSIETKGPILQAPEGTGLGFDDLLEKLPWKKLT